MPTRRAGRTNYERSLIFAFLSAQMESMIRTEEMIAHLLKILRWRTVLQRVARSEPDRHDRPGRCPRCHMVNTLYTEQGTLMIKCNECPAQLTIDEYEAEVLADPDAAVVPESRRKMGIPPVQ